VAVAANEAFAAPALATTTPPELTAASESGDEGDPSDGLGGTARRLTRDGCTSKPAELRGGFGDGAVPVRARHPSDGPRRTGRRFT